MTNLELTCPKCKEKLSYLYNVQSGEAQYRLYPDNSYDFDDFYPDDVVNDFRCPYCDFIIAYNESDALKFLRGEI